MITLDVAYQEPKIGKDVKLKYMSEKEWYDYRDNHTEITDEEQQKEFCFSTIHIYNNMRGIVLAYRVDSAMGVWKEETYREYVERTGDIWG